MDRFLRVHPGSKSVPYGSPVEIVLTLALPTIRPPVLYVREKNDWRQVHPNEERPQKISYEFKNIVEPLSYRVRWKKEWSERYVITPLQPIQIKKIKIQISHPSYVGKDKTTQESPEITALAGSYVVLEAETTVPIKEGTLIFSNKQKIKLRLLDSHNFRGEFSVEQSGQYGFILVHKDSLLEEKNLNYPVHVILDQSPQITLLSPSEDLVIGLSEKMPLTFDVRDDYGLKKLSLKWKKDAKNINTKVIKNYPKDEINDVSTYEWDLRKEKFRPGEIIHYQLEIEDGNTVTGPGRSGSQWQIIELASFEAGHEAIEEALKAWRDQALDLLAEINTTKAKIDRPETELSTMGEDIDKIGTQSKKLEEFLRRINKKMEEDPYADYGVWLEHEAMAESLAEVNRSSLQNLQSSYQTGNKKSASSELSQISSEIERMTALSEELTKTQKARDIVEAGNSLSDLGEDLLNQLEAASQDKKGLDPELVNEINELLSKAQEYLREMAKSIQDFPDELPEDFVNKEAIKNLDMGKSRDILSQIADAMKKGDLEKALRLAKQFLNEAMRMKEQLGEAHEKYIDSNSASSLAGEIEQQSDELDRIVQEQRRILGETQKLESERLKSVLEEQKKTLEDLMRKQKKVIDESEKISKEASLEGALRRKVLVQLQSMRNVLSEFEQKRIDKSPTWLEGIIKGFDFIQSEAEKMTISDKEMTRIKKIRSDEEEILKALRQPSSPSQPFSKESRKKFESLKNEQERLSKQTRELKQELQSLSQKTASLGLPLTHSLSEASQSMTKASQALGGQRSHSAHQQEEKALQQLKAAQKQLGDAQNSMSSMAQQQGGSGGPGGSGGGVKVLQRGGSGGSQGIESGKVRLPKAGDYKPPKEFREELLESLKEKYPEIYEKIIHKYYKRLSE